MRDGLRSGYMYDPRIRYRPAAGYDETVVLAEAMPWVGGPADIDHGVEREEERRLTINRGIDVLVYGWRSEVALTFPIGGTMSDHAVVARLLERLSRDDVSVDLSLDGGFVWREVALKAKGYRGPKKFRGKNVGAEFEVRLETVEPYEEVAALGDVPGVEVNNNGDLETWTSPTVPFDWGGSVAGGTRNQDTDAYAGAYCCRLDRSTTGNLMLGQIRTGYEPGRWYLASMYAKNSTARDPGVTFRFFNLDAGNEYYQNDGTWGSFSSSLSELPAGAIGTSYALFSYWVQVRPTWSADDRLNILYTANEIEVGDSMRLDNLSLLGPYRTRGIIPARW